MTLLAQGVLTYEEITNQHRSEWVLIGNPETSEDLKIIRGTVLWHRKDRDEVYRKAIELKPQRTAFLYTGEIPKDTAVVYEF